MISYIYDAICSDLALLSDLSHVITTLLTLNFICHI